MPKLSLWNNIKGKDYNFIDKVSRETFYVASLGILIHKYIGVINQGDKDDLTQPSSDQTPYDISTIQDMLWIENRNRKYDTTVYELKGQFQEADKGFEMLQTNLAISDGTKNITFHLNDMIQIIGRKLMPGDVIELPNILDEYMLDEKTTPTTQWYVVEDASFPSDGYSPLWWPHLWRVKVKPLTDAPEYKDITQRNDETIEHLLSTYLRNVEVNDAVENQAIKEVPLRNFETKHFYIVPGDEKGMQYPWIFAGDGVPPNNSIKADNGTRFPANVNDNDYFLRTDYEPAQLFQYANGRWNSIEIDYRKTWNKAHRILETFINETGTRKDGNEIIPIKQPLNKAVKPKADF